MSRRLFEAFFIRVINVLHAWIKSVTGSVAPTSSNSLDGN